MFLTTDSACFHFPTMLIPLISDAEPGIGTTKSVYNAPTDGFLMLPKLVLLFLINVQLMMLVETVLLAIKVTTLLTDSVSSPLQTTLTHLISAVEIGTGAIKSA
jgi:hypothetical protein